MRIAAAVTLLLVWAPLAGAQTSPALETEQDKTLYAIGYSISLSLQNFLLEPDELEIVIAALRDGIAGKDAAVDPRGYQTQIRELQTQRAEVLAAQERKASADWLAEMAKAKGASKKATGLVFVETQAGGGAHPTATSKVKVHYRGTLRDGSEFDSSHSRGQPAEFGLNQVIPCWTEALQLMKPGSKATIYCPADIAYGNRGSGTIPPGAALKFDVELLEIMN